MADSNAETEDEDEGNAEGTDSTSGSSDADSGSLGDYVRSIVEEVVGERRPSRSAGVLDTQRQRESSVAALVRKEQQKLADESAAKEKSEEVERRINALELSTHKPEIQGLRGWLSKHFWGNP